MLGAFGQLLDHLCTHHLICEHLIDRPTTACLTVRCLSLTIHVRQSVAHLIDHHLSLCAFTFFWSSCCFTDWGAGGIDQPGNGSCWLMGSEQNVFASQLFLPKIPKNACI